MIGLTDYQNVLDKLDRIIAEMGTHRLRVGQPVYSFHHKAVFIIAHIGDGFHIGVQKPNGTELFCLPATILYALDSDLVKREAFKVIDGTKPPV